MTKICLSLFIMAIAAAWPEGVRAQPGGDVPVRRYALIASASDGGPDRAMLRFADSDALAMAGVLRRLGGLHDADLVLLTGARRDTLEASFAWLRAAMGKGDDESIRRELVVYYAGHSDDQGLLLGGDRVSYRELTEWIESTSADVRIAILDRCGSPHRPARPDTLAAGRGRAFLTASAVPDGDGASFTHTLVSGMRGAADLSRDGRVTLTEAFRFARREAHRDRAGDVELIGQGDLVLTYLRSSKASLILDAQLAGGVAVSDLSGRVVLELRKQAAYPVELGLDPGSYEVSLVRDGRSYVAQVAVDDGAPVRLGSAQFAAEVASAQRPTVAAEASGPGRARQFGVYAGLGTRYTRLAGADGLLFAPEAGFLLDRRLALGLQGGAGWSDGGDGRTRLGYALLFARYHFRCDASIVCMSLAAAAGPGAVSGSDTVVLFEPQLGVHLIATRFLRFGADLGYRLVAGADDRDTGSLHGVSAGLNIQLGWF